MKKSIFFLLVALLLLGPQSCYVTNYEVKQSPSYGSRHYYGSHSYPWYYSTYPRYSYYGYNSYYPNYNYKHNRYHPNYNHDNNYQHSTHTYQRKKGGCYQPRKSQGGVIHHYSNPNKGGTRNSRIR